METPATLGWLVDNAVALTVVPAATPLNSGASPVSSVLTVCTFPPGGVDRMNLYVVRELSAGSTAPTRVRPEIRHGTWDAGRVLRNPAFEIARKPAPRTEKRKRQKGTMTAAGEGRAACPRMTCRISRRRR